MTTGIVSAMGRTMDAGAYDRPIHTDAAINPGNSGDPLVNIAGDAVGVNTALVSGTRGSVGLGFAIPINLAKAILPVLVQPVTTATSRALRLPGERGGFVIEVWPNPLAEQAGLQLGDVIVGYDRRSIAAAQDLGLPVAETAAGREVSVCQCAWRSETPVMFTERPDVVSLGSKEVPY